jgi:kynurenine formamidase
VKTGEIISLGTELDDPVSPFGRPAFKRTVRLHNDLRPLGEGRFMVVNDDQIEVALQGTSHWDSFAHFGIAGDPDHSVFHDGVGFEDTSPTAVAATMGIQALGPAIIARGVLVDLVAAVGEGDVISPDTKISRSMIEAAMAAQSVEVHSGDVVLLYTGFQAVRESHRGEYPQVVTGVDGSTVGLWRELDILALASDNPGIEAMPSGHELHIETLRRDGIPLGELWALKALADACRSDGRYDFLLISVPLTIHGAFGSPANAVAVR